MPSTFYTSSVYTFSVYTLSVRFATTCPHCQHENRVEFADSHIHEVTCESCGGRYCVFVRKQKFEMLFDLGTRALLDGYAREAVASFAAALERFFEFYIKATTLERIADTGGDFAEAEAALERTWRHVASQSERQVGMFALAYLLREGQEPEFLTPKALGADFRNRVIHRGYLPRHAEVEAYAAQVFALIDRLLSVLGPAALHAELLQERAFEAHLRELPDEIAAVFEEHPGMFRARRFGEAFPVPHSATANLLAPSQGKLEHKSRVPSAKAAAPLNSADAFRLALAERGEGLAHWSKNSLG